MPGSTSTLPKQQGGAAAATASVPVYKVDTRIDYAAFPIGSSLPGGGKVRVVPQSFGLRIPIGGGKPTVGSSNANSSSTFSGTSAAAGGATNRGATTPPAQGGGSSWASSIGKGQQQQQKGGWGSWGASAGRGGAAATGGSSSPASAAQKPSVAAAVDNSNKGLGLNVSVSLPLLSRTAVHTLGGTGTPPTTAVAAPPLPAGATTVTLANPLAAYVLSSAAVAKASQDGLSLGIVNGSLPIYAHTSSEFAAVEGLRQAVSHFVCTATPLPVPIVTLLASVLGAPCEASSVDTDLSRLVVAPLSPSPAGVSSPTNVRGTK